MSNGQLHDDKLFQGLHDRLSDYDAPYNGADWDAMSRKLDTLPKTNQFRWKFSLNTIGIMLGIVGLTVLGVVIAQGNGKPSAPAENRNVTTTAAPEKTPAVNATATQLPVQPAPTAVVVNPPANSDQAIPEMNTTKDLTSRKEKQKNDNPFRFGDQIDPIKGAIYNTNEDPALVNNHEELGKKPAIYYDIDENGKVKPIFIKNTKDTSNMEELTPDSVPQAPSNTPDPAAPTDGQRIGFDN
jgi:hypothetical protein